MKRQEDILIIYNNAAGRNFLTALYKVGFIGIILICAIILLDKSVANNVIMWSLVLMITLFWLIFGSFIKKLAYKISINQKTTEIQFYMLKDKQSFISKISEIKKVRINFYITFHFGQHMVICNDAINLELVENLEKFFVINYGVFGKLFFKLGVR